MNLIINLMRISLMRITLITFSSLFSQSLNSFQFLDLLGWNHTSSCSHQQVRQATR